MSKRSGRRPSGRGSTNQADGRGLRWTASLGRHGEFIPRGSGKAAEGEWDLTLRFTDVGERLYPYHLELGRGIFQQEVPVGGITARLVHGIKLGELVDAFRLEHQGDLAAQALFFSRHIKPRYKLPPKSNRAGPKGLGEEFYQDVAVAYVRAIETDTRRPIEVMARSYPGYSKENVRDWVARARQKGYLTSTAQGRAGGEPTKKLKDALAARGQERRRPKARVRAK